MTEPTVSRQPSKLARLWKCFLQGLFWTPLCVFAPAGLLQFMGMRPTESPIFLVAVVAFPLALTSFLYARTRTGQETVEGLVDRMSENIGQGFVIAGRSVGGCGLWLTVLAAFLFVVLGIVGLLVFGIRQIF